MTRINADLTLVAIPLVSKQDNSLIFVPDHAIFIDLILDYPSQTKVCLLDSSNLALQM